MSWIVVVFVVSLDLQPRIVVHWGRPERGYAECQEWAQRTRKAQRVVSAWCETEAEARRRVR